MTAHYIGIDVGGTSIKAAMVAESGQIMERASALTPARNLEGLLHTVVTLVRDLERHAGVSAKAVGVGIPGLLSSGTRVVQTSPHIPAIHNVNFESQLSEALSLRVTSENDANAGAYGEWACGAGRGLSHAVYLTLGTGLGCGLIIGGKLYRGASGYAGEMGHTVVEPRGRKCACGAQGCLETIVSATGMAMTARERGVGGPDVTAASLYDAAIAGDAGALAVFQETGRYLGMACANLINLLNPQTLIIGGGVMASGDLLLKSVREEVQQRAFRPSAMDCPIVQSQLWPDAGTIGGAMLARDSS